MNAYKLARIRAGMSAEEAANALGVSTAPIYSWERGDSAPKSGRIAKVAALYGVTVEELLDEKRKGGKG